MKARQNFGQVMNEVSLKGDDYIIERAGKPLVAIVSMEKYQILQKERENTLQALDKVWGKMKSEKPDDYVIATGETHTVRDFLEETFRLAGIEIESNGKEGIEEEYIRKDTGEVVVKINPRFFRPAEVDCLLGDPLKAKEKLGWSPRISFKELIKEMFEYDLLRLKNRVQ